MRSLFAGVVFASVCGTALAETCPGNPNALGVSREMTVRAVDYPRLGQIQYRETLPLADREVVLTFDDGPLLPYTDRVLDILASHCVKATFFLVGRHARAYPEAVRRIYNAGHTIGTHSQNHPLRTITNAQVEIDGGIESVAAALGDAKALAPFFRVPGLLRTSHLEAQAKARNLVVWSSDTLADDWKKITSQRVLQLALSRLESKGGGVMLLHDIQPRTVLMLPQFLTELKRRGFKIVHVVPEGKRPVLTDPTVVASARGEGWPRGMPAMQTTGSSANPAPAAAPSDAHASASAEAHDVPLPRPKPMRRVATKPKVQTVLAMRDKHAPD
jgi:peptidoglycan-N-acetylglucosamine deacetylase